MKILNVNVPGKELAPSAHYVKEINEDFLSVKDLHPVQHVLDVTLRDDPSLCGVQEVVDGSIVLQ